MSVGLKLVDIYRLTAQLSGDMQVLQHSGEHWGHVFSECKDSVELTVIHGNLILHKIDQEFQDKAFKISSDPEAFHIEASKTSLNPLCPDQIILTRPKGDGTCKSKKFKVKEGEIDYSRIPKVDKSDGFVTFTFSKIKESTGCCARIKRAFKKAFGL